MNEITKRKRKMQPKGTGFAAAQEYERVIDEKNHENMQYVFKTLKIKMNLPYNVNPKMNNFLSDEYCHFDTTLPKIAYHPLLQR